jgi:hypothetical protein
MFQLVSELDCFGGTPAVAIDDDRSLLFLGGREDAIVVGIEEAYDLSEGLSSVMIAVDFRMDGGVTVVKICGELHFWVLCVPGAYKASNKPNDDYVPGGGVGRRRIRLLGRCDARRQENKRGQDKSGSGGLPVPMGFHASSPGSDIRVPLGTMIRNHTYDVAAESLGFSIEHDSRRKFDGALTDARAAVRFTMEL